MSKRSARSRPENPPAAGGGIKVYAELAARRIDLSQQLKAVEAQMEQLFDSATAGLRTAGGIYLGAGVTLKLGEKVKVAPVGDTRSLVTSIIDSDPQFHFLLTCHFPTLIGWCKPLMVKGVTVPVKARKIWRQVDPRTAPSIDARRVAVSAAAAGKKEPA